MSNTDISTTTESISMEHAIRAVRIKDGSAKIGESRVAGEYPLTVVLDGQQLVTLLCSPCDIKALAAGFLFSEGLIKTREDIRNVILDEGKGIVRVNRNGGTPPDTNFFMKRVLTTGCGKGIAFYSFADLDITDRIESDIRVTPEQIRKLASEFQNSSATYQATHGVHSAALCDTDRILLFTEDIGRHNAIDKIFGRCLLSRLPVDDKILITSGRISSEILFKAARNRIPVLVSRSAPTDMGIRLAQKFGMTLVGRVRGTTMTLYTGEWRIHS